MINQEPSLHYHNKDDLLYKMTRWCAPLGSLQEHLLYERHTSTYGGLFTCGFQRHSTIFKDNSIGQLCRKKTKKHWRLLLKMYAHFAANPYFPMKNFGCINFFPYLPNHGSLHELHNSGFLTTWWQHGYNLWLLRDFPSGTSSLLVANTLMHLMQLTIVSACLDIFWTATFHFLWFLTHSTNDVESVGLQDKDFNFCHP